MKGSFNVSVSNKKVKYDFNIRRNITLLRGDSASGKTTLINMIDAYYNEGKNSGVKITCEKECVVLKGKNWERDLSDIKNSIVFIDEGSKFTSSHDFAREIQGTDNYYVIITRRDLDSLPYSVSEIYGMRTNGKKIEGAPIYNEMYMLYGQNITSSEVRPDVIMTEDSNAGNDFFVTVCENTGIKCLSAHGKSKIKSRIGENTTDKVLIIADGAAFGNEMNDVMQAIKEYPNYTLYLPESFEWLVLKSGVIKNDNIERILEKPSDYIESSEHFSWERYFTWLLGETTDKIKGISKYNKESNFDKAFKTPKCIAKILEQMNNIDF